MPYIDIDVDDFLFDCSGTDIKRIIKVLIAEGYDTEIIEELNKNKKSVYQGPEEIDECLIKIQDSQIQLTIEEENTIKQIANRLV
jgi:hypothetical protein